MKELNNIASIDPILPFVHQITIHRARRFKKKMHVIFHSLEQNLYKYSLLSFYKKKRNKMYK